MDTKAGRRAIAVVVTLLAAGGCDPLPTEPDPPPTSPPPVAPPPVSCATRPGGVRPAFGPPLFCGPTGPAAVGTLRDLNAFWSSSVQACSCGPDAFAQGCTNNAFVTPNGLGYIYYDASFLNGLSGATGSFLPPAYFLAHEFGHNIQLAYGRAYPAAIARELSADCYAGYFMGWLACSSRTNQAEIQQALAFACSIQDPLGTPWWDPRAHGTCAQRVDAVLKGFRANLATVPPIDACG